MIQARDFHGQVADFELFVEWTEDESPISRFTLSGSMVLRDPLYFSTDGGEGARGEEPTTWIEYFESTYENVLFYSLIVYCILLISFMLSW